VFAWAISPIISYSLNNGVKMLWMGDLETEFMENIQDDLLFLLYSEMLYYQLNFVLLYYNHSNNSSVCLGIRQLQLSLIL